MGWFDTLSENLVRQTTNTFLNVANTTAFESAMSQNCSNVVSFDGCKNIHDIEINQSMKCWINQDGMQTASQEASASVTDEKLVNQASETIAQNLDFNPGSKEARNITNLVTNLSIAISNTIQMTCTVSSNNVNSFACANSEGLYNIELNQTAETGIYSNCVQNSVQVANAQADLKSSIDQVAKTKVENAIAACLLAAAVLAVAVGIFYLLRGKGMASMAGGGGGLGGGLGGGVGGSSGGGKSKMKSVIIIVMVCLIFWVYVTNECNGNIQNIPVIGKILPHWCKGKTTPWIANIIFVLIILAIVYFMFLKPNAKVVSGFRFR